MKKQKVELSLPDKSEREVDAGQVHVWVKEKNGTKLENPYLASFWPRDWIAIKNTKGLLAGEVVHDPAEAKKLADEDAKARAKAEKEANDEHAKTVKRIEEANKVTTVAESEELSRQQKAAITKAKNKAAKESETKKSKDNE